MTNKRDMKDYSLKELLSLQDTLILLKRDDMLKDLKKIIAEKQAKK
jgi:hypothetical protein